MAITNIQVNFIPCDPAPGGGYNIEYRVIGDLSYIDGGNYSTSPADIPVSYPDGTLFEGIVHSECGDVVWSTAPIDDACCRFGYPGEDDIAGEVRSFDLTAAYTFNIVNGANPLFQIAGSSGQIVIGQYGVGTFLDTPVYGLGVLADGTVVEYEIDGSGAAMMRFAYPGEDDTGGETRSFDSNGFTFDFINQTIFTATSAADPAGTIQQLQIYKDQAWSRLITTNGGKAAFIATQTNGDPSTQPYIIMDSTDGTNLSEFVISPYDIHFSGNVGIYYNFLGANVSTSNILLSLNSGSTGTVVNGFGCQIDMYVQNDAVANALGASLVAKLIDVTSTTETSEFSIMGIGAGVVQTLLTILGTGLSNYANDAAAAAGTPPVPITGLYRNGSAVQIRVT